MMFFGVNIFMALLRAHFRNENDPDQAKNILTPANINSIVILNFFFSVHWPAEFCESWNLVSSGSRWKFLILLTLEFCLFARMWNHLTEDERAYENMLSKIFIVAHKLLYTCEGQFKLIKGEIKGVENLQKASILSSYWKHQVQV